MDNFYNSPILAKQLLVRNTHVTGTLRKYRRDNPKELVQTRLKKGKSKPLYCDGVAVSKCSQLKFLVKPGILKGPEVKIK